MERNFWHRAILPIALYDVVPMGRAIRGTFHPKKTFASLIHDTCVRFAYALPLV